MVSAGVSESLAVTNFRNVNALAVQHVRWEEDNVSP